MAEYSIKFRTGGFGSQMVFTTDEAGNITKIEFDKKPDNSILDEIKKYDFWYFIYNASKKITKFLFRNGEFYDKPETPLESSTCWRGGFRRINMSIKIACRDG